MNILNILQLIQKYPILFALLTLWSIIWKGIALWYTARNNQLAWFIALLVINTAGILEIIYLRFFQKKGFQLKYFG